MIKSFNLAAQAMVLVLLFSSCSNKTGLTPASGKVPSEIAAKVWKLGFDTSSIVKQDDGYLVEGDIFISGKDLGKVLDKSMLLRIAGSEQYRTTNLVTGIPRTISISVSNLPAAYTQAADEAIARYNNLRLGLTFQRVSSSASINIVGYYSVGGLAAYSGNDPNSVPSGYPSGGNPASQINLNIYYFATLTQAVAASIIQHEMGHCIGLRHTDYMDRYFSCGQIHYDEGQAGVGAIQIPGTPSTAEAQSYMLSCGSLSESRSFVPNDVIALAYLYNTSHDPGSQPAYEFYHTGNTDHVLTVNANYQNIYAGWSYIGASFRVFFNNSKPGTIPIYEYYNAVQKDHAYSPTPNDPNILGFPNWQQVGLAFYVYSSSVSGSLPVYMYYNASQTAHVYTSNSSLNTQYPGFTAPVLAWYAAQ